jgi:ElaB/YqjD/DUF883 family membrane-anchored ribosome-binding protein
MNKANENDRLGDELQELYIIVNNWITDVYFIQDEINFLLYVLNKYPESNASNGHVLTKYNFAKTLNEYNADIPCLINEIREYLKLLETPINDPAKDININLLEAFSSTDERVQTLSAAVKSVKKQLFACTEQIMKTEKALTKVKLNR